MQHFHLLLPSRILIIFFAFFSLTFACKVSATVDSDNLVQVRIATGKDDVEEIVGGDKDGKMLLGHKIINLNKSKFHQLVGLRYSLAIPQGATINQANLRFTTGRLNNGQVNLIIRAEDSDNAATFSKSLYNLSSRPTTKEKVYWSPENWAITGESDVHQTTPDLSTLIQEVVNRPSWAANNNLVLIISGTDQGNGKRRSMSYEYDVQSAPLLTVSYSENVTESQFIEPTIIEPPTTITDTNTNQPPIISGIPDNSVSEGETYRFVPTASDADDDLLNFSITNKPKWASFNNSNGRLSGTPGLEDAGTYGNITITVTDGQANASLAPFSITVTDSEPALEQGAPTLSSATLSGTSVTLVWTQANAIPEGGYDAIVDGIDTNATYRTTLLTSTIHDLDPAVEHCFRVQARYTDTRFFPSSNQLCTEANAQANTAPTINGTPVNSVTAGQIYSFVPTASDDDSDSLSFSIAQQPSWANFNTTTGELSGTPSNNDVGIYNNIVISVTDGSDTVSLNAFSITVDEPAVATGSADLAWETPTTRTDDSPLTLSEIGGYRIYMGSTCDDKQMIVDINDGTATNYTISDLSPGSYCFSVTTYDMDDNESSYSNNAFKNI